MRELREQRDTRITDHIKSRSSHQSIQPDLCDILPNNGQGGKNQSTDNCSKDVAGTQSKTMFSSIQQNIYACSCSKKSPIVPSPSPSCESKKLTACKKPAVTNINNIKCFDTTDDEDFVKRRRKTSEVNVKNETSKTNLRSAKRVPVKEIPTKPKITLKSAKSPVKQTSVTSQTNIHKRPRFLSSHVERITEDSLMISPELRTNDDFLEKIRQRDKEAMLRGQKALEKERLQREYNEMMKKLPALQKLERLYEMNQDKPEYHMTEERLREQEKKKQSILDDTYEKLFPDRRPPAITIPVKNTSRAAIGEKDRIQVDNKSPSLNLGTWEAGKKPKKLYTEEEVEALLRIGKIPSENKFRTDQLKLVLEKLRKQKEEILKEIHTQNLEVSPFSSSTRDQFKKNGNSSDSSLVGKKGDNRKKKFRSVKVGTNSLQNTSTSDTNEESVKKQPKTSTQTKSASKSVQATDISKKTKSSVQKTEEKSKTVSKERKKSSSESEHLKKSSSKESVELNKVVPNSTKKKGEKDQIDKPAVPSVPTNSLVSVNKEPVKDQKIQIKSCDCEKDLAKKPSELCEIVIKIKDGKSSQVLIKENGADRRNVATEKTGTSKQQKTSKVTQRLSEINKALGDDCCKDSSKPASWHEKFSKNNSQVSTSSTSYLSPPHLPNKREGGPKMPPYFCSLIGNKPQQLNLNSSTTKVQNQDVLSEVQKLLTMSRQSIDELGVSTVSSVTTPSQSIIDLDSNKMETSTNTRIDLISESSQSRTNLPNFSFLTVSTENRTIVASEMDSNEPYPDVLAKYAKIADQCSQRISNLTSMIEKVREDKNKMLQTSTLLPTNDSSTKYMDLPSINKSSNSKYSNGEQKSGSSSGDSKLLDINFSLAEKLKGLTPDEVQNFGLKSQGRDENDTGEENLAKRLEALKQSPSVINQHKDKSQKITHINIINNEYLKENKTEKLSPSKSSKKVDSPDFVPLLLDIPKIPVLATDSSTKKKPPPSKTFMAARKFTDFIAPHELSTIPEQDSQMRLEITMKDRSPKEQKNSPVADVVPPPRKSPTLEHKAKLKIDDKNSNMDNKKEKNQIIMRNTSTPVINSSKSSSKKDSNNFDSLESSDTSSNEKIEMLRIEAMLRSIGMEWAISTLRKTQEALALTSSSSSLDVKSPCTLKKFSDSDIKEYLSKQLFQKISSSTLRTDASPGSLNESQELSDILNSGYVYKQTSTPVNRSQEIPKTNEKSSDLPSAIESDKLTNNEFFSLNESQ